MAKRTDEQAAAACVNQIHQKRMEAAGITWDLQIILSGDGEEIVLATLAKFKKRTDLKPKVRRGVIEAARSLLPKPVKCPLVPRPGIDRESWELGVIDGAKGRKLPAWAYGLSKLPGRDSYSYNSGRIEGEAFRDGWGVSMDVARIVKGAKRLLGK